MAGNSDPRSSAPDHADRDSPGISSLLKRLGNETGELVRAEVALAKLEFRELARQAARDGMKVGAAATLALVGLVSLAGAAVLALGDLLGGRYGISALLVGLVLLGAGALLTRSAVRGMGRARDSAGPLTTLRQDGQWAADELRGLRRELQRSGSQAEQPALAKQGEKT